MKKMIERTKRPEYLSYLPQREYQDEIDVPAIIRRHNFEMDEKPVMETVERV